MKIDFTITEENMELAGKLLPIVSELIERIGELEKELAAAKHGYRHGGAGSIGQGQGGGGGRFCGVLRTTNFNGVDYDSYEFPGDDLGGAYHNEEAKD